MSVILLLLGLSRICAWALRSQDLDDSTFKLGAAPLPIAFSHHSGHEDFVLDGRLEFLNFENQLQHTLQLRADEFKNVQGSWSKKGVLLITALYAPRFDEAEVQEVLQSLACPLYKNISHIKLILSSRKASDWTFERSFHCAAP